MEECFRCHATASQALLFDAITMEGIKKICGKCSSRENIPLIHNSDNKEDLKFPSTRERLVEISKSSYVKPERTGESFLKKAEHKREDEEIRKSVEINAGGNMNDELIDNFHWIVMRARRMKHLTQEQFSEVVGIPVEIIVSIEKGVFPKRRDILRKIQNYLGISILRNPEPNDMTELKKEVEAVLKSAGELDFKNLDDLTISDLQEMKLRRERENEMAKDSE